MAYMGEVLQAPSKMQASFLENMENSATRHGNILKDYYAAFTI